MVDTAPVWAIVVAAGVGSRFGSPKQYAPLGGRRVLDWSLASAQRAAPDAVVLVVSPERVGDEEPSATRVVAGGDTRSASVRAGLAAVPEHVEIVAVHDGARPFASHDVWRSAIDAVVSGADGAVPSLPVVDTLVRTDGERMVGVADRTDVQAVQTPQVFRTAALRSAHAGGAEATDDTSLVAAAGGRVVVVPGDPANAKITTPADLVRAEAHLTPARVGHGFDSHARSDDPDRPLVLAGVRFPGEAGLAGHSDADVVCHAVADALLGAAGRGDIGMHFPDTDPAWEGADSVALLRRVVHDLLDEGWRPGAVDCTVMCERPRLADRRREMVSVLGAAVGAPVSIKATRPEGLGALAEEGTICCWAVATLAGGISR